MNQKACILNGSEEAVCPNCGRTMQKVEYYTARPIRQSAAQRSWDTKIVTTTYTDVNPHIGNICLVCANENEKSKRIAGLIMMIAGGFGSFAAMLTGLVLSTLAESQGGDVGAALGTPMVLMCGLLVLAVIGLVLFLGSNSYRSVRSNDKDKLFLLFLQYIKSNGMQSSGVVYLNPRQAARMRKN